ncbi:DNA primase [Acidiferrimicrobium sp. IK]|uniref:DNA primase n=1 Tax=Acidiferrimicrobium sp. IK TaxID=2871700 RepID=UPI0021CB1B28|nr:DNA primase [Acidiferrimicrobium sp. IK]MCU4183933.1 DNA primase [Acidiferrimicrobium sp. IK]
MGIVDEDIARVRAATDLVAVASEHMALRKVGLQWSGLCPFHSEKSPSFSINNELGVYYCFGCQASGDAISFVREMEHLDFADAVERLAAKAGITLRYDDAATGRNQVRRAKIYETLEAAIAWYHQQLKASTAPDANAARRYLRRERGYDSDVVTKYQLGWAPDGWDHLVKAMRVPPQALVEAGLATLNDRGRYNDFFRGRLLFPIFDASGRPLGAGGRMLPGGRPPKYKNTAGTAVYDKSQVLYGLNWAKRDVVERGRIVICEGYTDVIGLHRAGIGEAVATCGTALADGHIKLLTRFARKVVLAYDADGAGQAAAEHFYEWERRFDLDIRVAALPPGADPADLARSDPDALKAAIDDARPYLGFRLARLFAAADLSTPEGRARAATTAMALVREHPSDLVQDQYLMEVADRCRLSPDRLRTMEAAPPGGEGSGRSAASGPAPGAAPGGSRRAGGTPPGHDRRPGPASSAISDGTGAPAVGGAELEALRLAVHRPEELAGRLERVLFAHPLAVAAFDALAGASTLHEAIEWADPQTAGLLQRLAVEPPEEETDDVMVRLVERAGKRALDELGAEMRSAPDPSPYAPLTAWLKLALEMLRPPEGEDPKAAQGAEVALVDWLVARSQPETDPGTVDPDPSPAPTEQQAS